MPQESILSRIGEETYILFVYAIMLILIIALFTIAYILGKKGQEALQR